MTEISSIIKEKAPFVLAEIKKANSILLHCHPSPDPDSVGSALAMKFALEQMGKRATVIKGDWDIPQAFMHFPGAGEIVKKNFFEIDPANFDLFVAVDAASKEQVSRAKPIPTPLPIRTVVIDHHKTNTGYGDINLVEPSYPATCQILFDLFPEIGVKMTRNIAANLFIGIYTDTGGFKYEGTTAKTFDIASRLIGHIEDFRSLISKMENSNSPAYIKFQGIALSSIRTFLNGKLALSVVSNEVIEKEHIPSAEIRSGEISSILRTVADWDVMGAMFEVEPGRVRTSFRTRDAKIFDVSKLAAAIGGGGHAAAAAASLSMPLEDAVVLVVDKAKMLYNIS